MWVGLDAEDDLLFVTPFKVKIYICTKDERRELKIIKRIKNDPYTESCEDQFSVNDVIQV